MAVQNRMRDARVVYCSATGASEPRNMGYMARLGLWGTGTDFPKFSCFLGKFQARAGLVHSSSVGGGGHVLFIRHHP